MKMCHEGLARVLVDERDTVELCALNGACVAAPQLDYMSAQYEQRAQAWAKKMDRRENGTKRRAKEAKMREIFEKTFPELKKQREEKEKVQRSVTAAAVVLLLSL